MPSLFPRLDQGLRVLQWRVEQLTLLRRAPWLAKRLHRLFPRDLLTGLYKRQVLIERVQATLAAGEGGALLVLNVDHLAWFNYNLGHIEGDACLCHIASLLPSERLSARIGGDEFAVYTEQASEAEVLAESIRMRVAQDARLAAMRATSPPWRMHGSGGPLLTVSIGVVRIERGNAVSELLQTARDAARTGAKAAGRNCVVLATMPA